MKDLDPSAKESLTAQTPVMQELVGKVVFVSHRKAPDVYWASDVEIKDGMELYAAPVSAPKQDPVAWKEFNEWMHRELPSGTVIGDPGWWASKIYKHFIQNAAPVSAKREWVDLTEGEQEAIYLKCNTPSEYTNAVIAAFKEKNK